MFYLDFPVINETITNSRKYYQLDENFSCFFWALFWTEILQTSLTGARIHASYHAQIFQ